MPIMRFYCLVCALLLLFQVQDVMAQDPVYRQFTNQNGLPSSEVYDVLQDNRGYMWFSTDQGLARFDGYRFQVYDESKGLPENTVFDLELDASGKLWVNTIKGHFAYVEHDSVFPYHNNKMLDSLYENYSGIMKIFDTYHVDTNGKIRINIWGKGLLEINSDGNLKWLKQEERKGYHELLRVNHNKVLRQSALDIAVDSFLIENEKSHFKISTRIDTVVKSRLILRTAIDKKSIFLSVNETLYEIDSSGFIRTTFSFKSNIQALLTDPHGGLWVGTASEGVYYYKEATLGHDPLNFLKRISVSSFFIDHEEGLWITSLNKGVFHIPILGSYFLSRKSDFNFENVIDIEVEPNGTLWLGLNRGRVLQILPNGKMQEVTLKDVNSPMIDDLEFDFKTSTVWIATSENLYKINSSDDVNMPLEYSTVALPHRGLKSIFLDENGTAFFGHFSGFSKVDMSSKTVLLNSQHSDFNHRIEDIVVIDDHVYLATLSGVWDFHDNKFTQLGIQHPLLANRATRLAASGDTLLVGTKGNGLLMLAGDSVMQFDKQDGLASNAVTAIEVHKDLIYVGTNAGLSLLNKAALNQKSLIQTFNVNSGMHANEINSICVVDDYVYLATTDGLHMMHNDAIKKANVHLPIYITGVNVNNKSRAVKDVLKLPFSENNIQIDYFALSYRNTGRQTYRHRMLGLGNNWVINQKTNAQYPYLPAGSYIFEVSVQNGNGSWNPDSAMVEIIISKPYWAELWFILLVLAFITSILTLLFFWRIKLVKRRNQLIYDINWYQQEALINQMNPHFLFNALNTVHRYVLQNDRVASSRYLTRFATLMRKILDMSQEKSLTIAKEIDALKLYLELESARFKDKFQFTIEVDASITQDKVLIPVFIIQPIAENAIWHGLMHSDKQGKIDIHFFRKAQNDLIVSIRDNGIGREEAEKLRNLSKPDQRKSLGLAIIKRRIALINTQQRTNISISYNDLKAAYGSCAGTEVTVCFPNFLK